MVAHHRIMATTEPEFPRDEMTTMRKPTVLAPIVLILTLSLSVALADRMKERAWQDRFSFGDSPKNELLAE